MNKRITFLGNEIDEENIRVVMEESGVTNVTQAVKTALAFTARKLRPSYVSTAPSRAPMTDEERTIKASERVRTEKETRAKINKQRGDELCALLGGEAVKDPETGSWSCIYPLYKLEERHESVGGSFVEKWTDRAFYNGDLNDKHLETQYRTDGNLSPAPEMVELIKDLIKKGKVKEV